MIVATPIMPVRGQSRALVMLPEGKGLVCVMTPDGWHALHIVQLDGSIKEVPLCFTLSAEMIEALDWTLTDEANERTTKCAHRNVSFVESPRWGEYLVCEDCGEQLEGRS